MLLFRPADEPVRQGLSHAERWEGPDDGLITCWETGRELRLSRPLLVTQAESGVLMELPWKGGANEAIKSKRKYGSLYYLAMWQGLRGEPLAIDTAAEIAVVCSRTGVQVTFTADRKRWAITA